MSISKNIHDHQLLNLLKKGNELALGILMDRYSEKLAKYVFQVLKSRDLTEEAVANVFVKLWQHRKQINICSSLKAWLYRVAKNEALNLLDKENRKHSASNVDDFSIVSPLAAPDQALHYDDLTKKIDDLISHLPGRRGMIFRLSRIDGLKYEEIADIMSISVNTVQNQMVQAVKYMTRQLPDLKKLVSWIGVVWALVLQ